MINTIETISKWNTSVWIFSDRGWIITSININGIELLYQDMYEETLFDDIKSVKGGIPYMFPNAWPLSELEKEKSWFNLPQHWTWRINKWENIFCENWKYVQKFKLDNYDLFPFHGEVINSIQIEESWVNITHKIVNRWNISLPISTWLHPYFRVPLWNKKDIEWNFKWWEEIKSDIDIWSNDWTITFDNPGMPLEIFIPDIGTIVIDVSSEYKKFWVRSLPNKDFICIEPVMWNEWDIVKNQLKLNLEIEI